MLEYTPEPGSKEHKQCKKLYQNSLFCCLFCFRLVCLCEAPDINGWQLSLVTVHASKGLEFKVVFCVGLEEGTFPHHRTFADAAQLQEV